MSYWLSLEVAKFYYILYIYNLLHSLRTHIHDTFLATCLAHYSYVHIYIYTVTWESSRASSCRWIRVVAHRFIQEGLVISPRAEVKQFTGFLKSKEVSLQVFHHSSTSIFTSSLFILSSSPVCLQGFEPCKHACTILLRRYSDILDYAVLAQNFFTTLASYIIKMTELNTYISTEVNYFGTADIYFIWMMPKHWYYEIILRRNRFVDVLEKPVQQVLFLPPK